MARIIQAQIEEPIAVARHGYPLTHGCPFPQGALNDPGQIRLTMMNGTALPLQTRPLAHWPDGSIKWLLMDTQVDLRPSQILPLRIEYGEDVSRSKVSSPLRADKTADGLRVQTGSLTMTLNDRGAALITRIEDMPGQDDEPQLRLKDAEDLIYAGRIEHLEVEEENALRLVVRAKGGFVSQAGARPMSWIVRFYFFANQSFVKMYHTFIHDQDEPVLFHMREMKLSLPLVLQGDPHVMLGAPKWNIARGEDVGVTTDAVELWETGPNQHTVFGLPQGRMDRRTASHGWIYAGDDRRGMQIKLRNPSQNYPKVYAVDRSRLEIHLYPDSDRWTPPEEQGRSYTELNRTVDGEYDGPLQVPQGMAKTHEIYLYCGPAARDLTDAASMAAAWQFPLLLEIDSTVYADSGALGTFPPHYRDYWLLEEKLRADLSAGTNGSPLMGMINFGDTGQTTVENGQQKTLTTDNLSYDHTRAYLRQYMRRGDQPLFWQGEAMALHLMDVDTVHHSTLNPERVGGPRQQWSQFHHYTDTARQDLAVPRTSHVWIGGLLDLYYLTGYQRALDVVESTGRFCAGTRARVGWDDIPAALREDWGDPRLSTEREGYPDWFSPRRAGWALTGMADLYEVKPDPALAEEMRAMVDVLEKWQDDEGRWRSLFGAFVRGTQVFMTAAILTGLMRVWELLDDEKAGDLCIKGCRFLATTTVTKDGLMYYKEAPINKSAPASSNILCFRPMAFAYAQTQDPDILRAMWRLFRWMMEKDGPQGYEVKDALWALPVFKEAGLLEMWRNEEIG